MPENTIDIFKAVKSGDIETVKKYIENGGDANAKDISGCTPLHNCNNSEIAKLLLEHGADVNAKNNDGQTPFHICKNNDMLHFFIRIKEASLRAKDNFGKTPLNNPFVKQYMEHARRFVWTDEDVIMDGDDIDKKNDTAKNDEINEKKHQEKIKRLKKLVKKIRESKLKDSGDPK